MIKMMFLLSPKIWYFLKYGILVLIVGGVLVSILTTPQLEEEIYGPDELDLFGENDSSLYLHDEFTLKLLQRNFTECLLKPKEKWKINDTLHWNINDPKEEDFSTLKAKNKKRNFSRLELLMKFSTLLSFVNVKAAIIEPSILYCMLQSPHQDLLMKRNFNISRFSFSENSVTYGILHSDAVKLQQEENILKFTNAGFKPFSLISPITDWMLDLYADSKLSQVSTHLFYIHEGFSFHFVVFFERKNYLWHAAINKEQRKKVPIKSELLFGGHNGGYERFNFVPLTSPGNSIPKFYIPTNPHYFLFQMASSKFLECDMSRAKNVTGDSGHPTAHPLLSVERFNLRTRTVLHQLKSIFQPLLLNLWLWSGTMLGWYRQCDIIPYTTDVDFAAWADEVNDLDQLIDLLRNNQYATIKMRMGLLKEALEFQLDCMRLRTDIFFMYRIKNGSWCSGHSPKLGYYFRYYYPHFTLCSAELLGEKVQVPCETEKVIISEYGPNWSKPESSWNYEKSVSNRGPNIHWSKKKFKDAYQVY